MPQVKTDFRRLECDTDHNTRKFWEIEKIDYLDNPEYNQRYGYTTYWGRVGNKGSAKTKWFSNVWARNNIYSRKTVEKLHKGYIQVEKQEQSPYETKTVEARREEDAFLKKLPPSDADRLKAVEFDFE